jgi:hypothetical protein
VLTLQVLLPQSTKKDLEREKESLHNSIIRPAIKLAESIQMSPEKFTLAFSDFAYALNPNDRGDPPGILEGIHKLDCLNILQGGKALSSSALQDSGARGNTTYLLDIYPGLYCQTLNGDVPSDIKVLKKPKVLVAMVRPGQGSNHVHEGSTLMDFIYDQVYP